MVVVVAIIYAKAGKGPELEKELLELQAKVLKDPGAIAYVLHRCVDDPNKYFVYEKYESDEAFKYHTSTEHFNAFFQKLGTLIEGELEVSYYQEIE